MVPIDLKHAVIKIKGGTAGNSITVKIGAGNLTWDEHRAMQYLLDRGLLDTVREGDEVPIDAKLDFQWDFITAESGGTVPSIEDALKHRGHASAWTSAAADPCEPFAVDIVLEYTPPCSGTTPETIILADFRYETLAHDLRAGTVSMSGKCNVTEAVATRGAIST